MKLADFLALQTISQAEFAARLGVSQAAVSRYVAGRRMPLRKHLSSIQEITKGAVTANDFVGSEARAS